MTSDLDRFDALLDQASLVVDRAAGLLERPQAVTALLALLHLVAAGSVADYLAAHNISAIVPAVATAVAGGALLVTLLVDTAARAFAAKHLAAADATIAAAAPAITAAGKTETTDITAAAQAIHAAAQAIATSAGPAPVPPAAPAGTLGVTPVQTVGITPATTAAQPVAPAATQ